MGLGLSVGQKGTKMKRIVAIVLCLASVGSGVQAGLWGRSGSHPSAKTIIRLVQEDISLFRHDETYVPRHAWVTRQGWYGVLDEVDYKLGKSSGDMRKTLSALRSVVHGITEDTTSAREELDELMPVDDKVDRKHVLAAAMKAEKPSLWRRIRRVCSLRSRRENTLGAKVEDGLKLSVLVGSIYLVMDLHKNGENAALAKAWRSGVKGAGKLFVYIKRLLGMETEEPETRSMTSDEEAAERIAELIAELQSDTRSDSYENIMRMIEELQENRKNRND
jgi:hypothetical protein